MVSSMLCSSTPANYSSRYRTREQGLQCAMSYCSYLSCFVGSIVGCSRCGCVLLDHGTTHKLVCEFSVLTVLSPLLLVDQDVLHQEAAITAQLCCSCRQTGLLWLAPAICHAKSFNDTAVLQCKVPLDIWV